MYSNIVFTELMLLTLVIAASRADEKQLPASTEQVRERRAGVGPGRGGGGGAAQEGRAAAEGHSLVGAPAARRARAAALRHGAAPRAARRVTSHGLDTYHAYIPLSGRDSPPRARPGVL